jgi:heme exporter protein A
MKFEAKNISINRGARRIIQSVNFTLNNGDALIVTGENGSGKSTLLRALAGLLPFAEGSLFFDLPEEGKDDPLIIREHIHYLGHQNGMKPALSVRENLEFWQGYSTPSDSDESLDGMSIIEALDFVELPHVLELPYGYLSTGMKRRVSIAKLLITEKPIWIVDEPTAGLDAKSSAMFTDLCKDHCSNGGILIAATHLPLGIDGAKKLEVEQLYTFHEGDDLFDEPESGS